MGLDNGVVMKNLPEEDYSFFIDFKPDSWEKDEIHLCYWRKCWNVRKVFLDVLHGEDGEITYIDKEDIPALIRELLKLCSKEVWEENNDSIWTWEEMRETLITQIVNLKLLYKYMENHPDFQVYFYDSY